MLFNSVLYISQDLFPLALELHPNHFISEGMTLARVSVLLNGISFFFPSKYIFNHQ